MTRADLLEFKALPYAVPAAHQILTVLIALLGAAIARRLQSTKHLPPLPSHG